MSYGSKLAVVAQDQALASASFVPSAVVLGNQRSSSLVWRSRLGAVVLSSGAISPDGSVLTVFLEDGSSYRCLAAAFGGSFPIELLDAVRSAVEFQLPVFLCVAVGRSGNAAPGYFCGLSSQLPTATVPTAGSVNW